MTPLAAMRNPTVLRGMVAIFAALAVLIWPSLFGSLLLFLIGGVAVAVGLIELVGWFQTHLRSQFFQGLLLTAFGLAVLIGQEMARRTLVLLIAGVIGLRALHRIFTALSAWRKEGEDPFWGVAVGFLALALALAFALIPEALFTIFVVGVAVVWIVAGGIVLFHAVGEDAEATDVLQVIRSRSMAADLRRQVTESIFEDWDSKKGTVRFTALMTFATAIATFGIKADSTAVVIGAMLIAPLMSPIVALSASILMGWPKRAGYSGIRVAIGVIIGIAGSFFFSLMSPEFVEVAANSQILSRASPTLLDLLIALAAGAAGGYAVTHPKVSNSLPGVAIAVALAPPLAVVGVTLQEGAFGFAAGAFLLFLTNLVGIVVATGFTYILSGYSPWSHLERSGEQGRRSLVLVGIALVLVTFPLIIIGEGIIATASTQSRAQETVEVWLGEESDFSIARVAVTGKEVHVVIVGPGDPPDPENLAVGLANSLDRNVTVQLEVIPEQKYEIEATPGSGSP